MATRYGVLNYTTIAELVSVIAENELVELTTDRLDVPSIVDVTTLANALAHAEWQAGGEDGAEPTVTTLEEKMSDAIYDAAMRGEAEVNSYLSVRYTIPVAASDATTPWEVTDKTQACARFNLFKRRPHIPDGVLRDYEYAKLWLKDVSRGQANVNAVTVAGVSEPSTSRTIQGTSDRTGMVFDDFTT